MNQYDFINDEYEEMPPDHIPYSIGKVSHGHILCQVESCPTIISKGKPVIELTTAYDEDVHYMLVCSECGLFLIPPVGGVQ